MIQHKIIIHTKSNDEKVTFHGVRKIRHNNWGPLRVPFFGIDSGRLGFDFFNQFWLFENLLYGLVKIITAICHKMVKHT